MQAQGGAGVPFPLFVAELAAFGCAAVIAQCGGHVLVQRLIVAQYAPCVAALGAAQAAFHARERGGCSGTFACVFADDGQQAVFLRTLSAAVKRAAQCCGQIAGVGGLAVAQ